MSDNLDKDLKAMMSKPKRRWPTSLAMDVAAETVRSYLRMGTPIKAAIREAARDWHMGESTLRRYWYKKGQLREGRVLTPTPWAEP